MFHQVELRIDSDVLEIGLDDGHRGRDVVDGAQAVEGRLEPVGIAGFREQLPRFVRVVLVPHDIRVLACRAGHRALFDRRPVPLTDGLGDCFLVDRVSNGLAYELV